MLISSRPRSGGDGFQFAGGKFFFRLLAAHNLLSDGLSQQIVLVSYAEGHPGLETFASTSAEALDRIAFLPGLHSDLIQFCSDQFSLSQRTVLRYTDIFFASAVEFSSENFVYSC